MIQDIYTNNLFSFSQILKLLNVIDINGIWKWHLTLRTPKTEKGQWKVMKDRGFLHEGKSYQSNFLRKVPPLILFMKSTSLKRPGVKERWTSLPLLESGMKGSVNILIPQHVFIPNRSKKTFPGLSFIKTETFCISKTEILSWDDNIVVVCTCCLSTHPHWHRIVFK